MVLLCRSEEIRSNGAYIRWGPLGEVSLSLFTMELERWALNIHFLISLDSTDGFECPNLQVKDLTESHHFGGLFAGFGHMETLHE